MGTGAFSIINRLTPIFNPSESGPLIGPLWGLHRTDTSITATDAAGKTTVYTFDAILRADHMQALQKTENPVQNGAAITDHAFLLPARIVLEVGMSDVMHVYSTAIFTSSISKSVAAYQTLLALQQSRTLLTLTTRLRTYSNVLLEAINANDTSKTRHGLRAVCVFCQIFLASVSAVGDKSTGLVVGDDTNTPAASARPNATDSTPLGSVQTSEPSAALTSQNSVPGTNSWSST